MARQAGVGQARCDVIAVMDSHVEVAEGKLHVQCVSYIAVWPTFLHTERNKFVLLC